MQNAIETINNTITSERAKYYRAVAEGLYLKTREMSDQFGKSFGGYTKIIQERYQWSLCKKL